MGRGAGGVGKAVGESVMYGCICCGVVLNGVEAVLTSPPHSCAFVTYKKMESADQALGIPG